MHKWAEEILEKVKTNAEEYGIDNFCGQKLDDLKDFTEVVKNIVMYDYYFRIVEEMEGSSDNRYFTEIDKKVGRAFYTEPDGEFDAARKKFLESKEMHDSESSADQTENMLALERMVNALSSDMEEVVEDMTQAEKSFLKQRLNAMGSKL